jgi:hypothetical protein
MTKSIDKLAAEWLEAKDSEKRATAKRREIEDEIINLSSFSSQKDETQKMKTSLHAVKIVSRIDRKVDSEKVQELAAEHGLTDHLGTLFRWKPEINMAAWNASDESITRPLAAAITAKPGRPSFTIESITTKEN